MAPGMVRFTTGRPAGGADALARSRTLRAPVSGNENASAAARSSGSTNVSGSMVAPAYPAPYPARF